LRRNSAATLSPTTLLHETYLNLSQNQGADFSDRAQFLGYAARAMRGLLIDYLRMRQARKRGGGFEITSLGADQSPADHETEAVQIGVALESLAQIDARLAECVDLKFFCGFTNAEIAELWKVSERTVVRVWDKARVMLRQILSETAPQATP
jgi:RNA polymerase sigma factor (TIGR02999 family)